MADALKAAEGASLCDGWWARLRAWARAPAPPKPPSEAPKGTAPAADDPVLLNRLPEPLTENPPLDRHCDLVLTGGIASGVVYPWAILELARAFRFRNIGGTSVGAVAAAVAAASEYGRRRGNAHAFEVLRQIPKQLAERVHLEGDDGSKTRLRSLFQPSRKGERLMELLLDIVEIAYARNTKDRGDRLGNIALAIVRRYAIATSLGIAAALLVGSGFGFVTAYLAQAMSGVSQFASWAAHGLLVAAVVVALASLVRLIVGVMCDARDAIVRHDLGLCRGRSERKQVDGQPAQALVEWMHEGIQRAAGLEREAGPLTFEDLWHAPLAPGGAAPTRGRDGRASQRAINLQMMTTNVTHGRPCRLPLADDEERLFFDPREWARFFPEVIMRAVCEVAAPYAPHEPGDPPPPARALREVPRGKLPIVVAARLSLSFPVLFAAVPMYAVDRERALRHKRLTRMALRRRGGGHEAVSPVPLQLKRVRFSDGGLCANFPVHFFDAALPRWPTFGLWLEERGPYDPPVELAQHQDEGGDAIWQRFEPTSLAPLRPDGTRPRRHPKAGTVFGEEAPQPGFGTLFSFLTAGLATAKDWRDLTALQMPHVRRRVARIALKRGEGELHIAMPPETIMRMAAGYGTRAGRMLREAYAAEPGAVGPTAAWREHLWVRLDVLLQGLEDLLGSFDVSTHERGHSEAVRALVEQWKVTPPLVDPADERALWPAQAAELTGLVEDIERLTARLRARQRTPHRQQPAPELRLRPRL